MSRPLVSAEEARKLLDGATEGDRTICYDGVGHQAFARGGGEALFHLDTEGDARLHAAAPDLAHTVVVLSEERDDARRTNDHLLTVLNRVLTILNCETGKSAPGNWTRNDVDPKREGIAWYRRWEADGSEPGEEDTDQTRVAWVRHDSEDMTAWCWEIEAPTLGAFGKQIAHGENYETAYEAIEACDKCAEVEADAATKVTK